MVDTLDPVGPPQPRDTGFSRWCQRIMERSLGVRIYRHPPPGRYFYPQLPRLHDWTESDVVFDVGANDGRTVLELRRHLEAPRIYAFEPVAATYAQLVARTQGMPRVYPMRIALGDAVGEADIYLHDLPVLNSFRPPADHPAAARERVPVSTVDTMMRELGVNFIHFLKIDTEGHEMAVLEGASDALDAGRVAIVQLEVGVGQMDREFCTIDSVRAFLSAKGYYLHGVFNQNMRPARPSLRTDVQYAVGYRPSVLAYCDAVFVSAQL